MCQLSQAAKNYHLCGLASFHNKNTPSKLARFSLLAGGLNGLRLRASDEGYSSPAFSEAAGVVSIARIERPLRFHLLP